MKKPRVRYSRKFWTNLNWLLDGDGEERQEIYIYKTKSHCQMVMPTGDKMIQVKITEVVRRNKGGGK